MQNIQFARNLVKGKIAETVFAQMFRETKAFTVLEFGYEKVIPELVQQGLKKEMETLNILRTAPDFAVIDHTSHEVRLVEVKYLRQMNSSYVLRDAQRMAGSWNPSYLFIASSDGFYFDSVKNILENKGSIKRFVDARIPETTQQEYLRILNDFEGSQKNQ